MSTIRTLEIPKWGLSMEEGTLAQWLIKEGSAFSQGQDICEIETSKITNVLEAPWDGVLRRVLAQPGDTLPVGAVLALVADEQVSDSELDAFAATLNSGAPQPAAETAPSPAVTTSPEPSAPAKPAAQDGIPAALRGETDETQVNATSHALRLAKKQCIDLSKVSGSGRDGRISVADLQAAITAGGGSAELQPRAAVKAKPRHATQDDSQIPATPIARRLASQLGINLHDCRRSGSAGRVSRADVEALAALRGSGEKSVARTAEAVEERAAYDSQTLSAMRRTIASRLQESKRNAPHFRLVSEVDLTRIQALRREVNSALPSLKVTLNDLLVKACAQALMSVPEMNVQYDEASQTIRRFHTADIAIAVALPGGLYTPILREANRKTVGAISRQLHELVTRTKAGTLKAEDFQGGTFCISNLGMFGIRQFDAIINPPQCAILAVGAAESRAVVHEGQIVARERLTLSLSCDHRVIDGAVGATFMQHLQRAIETPSLMLVEEARSE
ncbi:2-oxo acid dehydrogenase subunit E2 [Kosakonia cowanii]|uniref:2-oxo acid dehydrogenase subunit E2 n=1 Tax=Kosakonia TaxID=1330547 RepID=UPI00190C84B8|nr:MULTISPECIES: 2-oxo acid dehydrogenase subunit E2 [Kosakonia]MBK0018688.1 2-oxo acid dehydrogenase subunit E2 [Kosakonia sp. S42]UGS45126.1 2-oxo acid dehydrogenase subunit E2 [Kosakonia cowanii]